jgi:hypothetical protein
MQLNSLASKQMMPASMEAFKGKQIQACEQHTSNFFTKCHYEMG